MRRIQALPVLLAALLLSSLAITPAAIANNDSDEDEKLKHKAEVMLKILNQTKLRVDLALSLLTDIPPNVEGNYSEAVDLYNEILDEFMGGNYSGSIELSRQALAKFKLCLKLASEILTTEVGDVMAWRGLTVALNRLRMFIEKVNNTRNLLYEQYDALQYYIEQKVDQLIKDANETAAEAETRLEEGNYTGAAKLIGEGHAKAAKALAALNKLVKHKVVRESKVSKYMRGAYKRFRDKVKRRARFLKATPRAKVLMKLEKIAEKLQELEKDEQFEKKLNEIQQMISELMKSLETAPRGRGKG